MVGKKNNKEKYTDKEIKRLFAKALSESQKRTNARIVGIRKAD